MAKVDIYNETRAGLLEPLSTTGSLPGGGSDVSPKASGHKLGEHEVIRLIVGIFEETLQLGPVDEHSNFFDEGGDSLLALTVIARIEEETGARLSVTALYETPTAVELAQRLAAPDPQLASTVVTLRNGNDTRRLFLLHGIGGSSLEQIGLANAIQPGCAIYGFQAKGLTGGETPLQSVEELAATYFAEVRRIQPNGPYAFAGYSFGGLVAMEMAQNARAAGEEVAFVALIDSYLSVRFWTWSSRLQVWMRLAALHARIARRMPAATIPDYLLGRVRTLWRLLKVSSGKTAPPPALPPSWAEEEVLRVRHANLAAASRYCPRPYDGHVIFVRSELTPRLPSTPAREWRRFAASVEVIEVPGDHSSLIREHVGLVARVLSAALSQSASGTSVRRPIDCAFAGGTAGQNAVSAAARSTMLVSNLGASSS